VDLRNLELLLENLGSHSGFVLRKLSVLLYDPMYIIPLAVNRYKSTRIVVNQPELIFIGYKTIQAQSLQVDYSRSRLSGID